MLTDTMKEELVKGLCEIFKSDIEAIILYGSVLCNISCNESCKYTKRV